MNNIHTLEDFYTYAFSQAKTPEERLAIYFIKEGYMLPTHLEKLTWDDVDLEKQLFWSTNYLVKFPVKFSTKFEKEFINHFKYTRTGLLFDSKGNIHSIIERLSSYLKDNPLTKKEIDSIFMELPNGIFKSAIPPKHLRYRISGSQSYKIFEYGGYKLTQIIFNTLQYFSQNSKEILLDWGCGCGRLANQLILKKNIDYTGCDIDKEAVDWCTSNLDGTFYVTELNPPLPFATNTFTSVVGISVMTHLTEQHQQIWLKEMHRVLKKDGLLLLSVHGKPASIRDGLESNLNENGFFDGIIDNALGNIVPNNYYRATFQTKEYTYKNWTKYFDIIEYNEQAIFNHQDLVVLRKKKVKKWFQF